MIETDRPRKAMSINEIVTEAGSLGALAAICGCSAPNIWQLQKRESPLPARYVLAVERSLGLSRHRIRPDLYPVDTFGRAA